MKLYNDTDSSILKKQMMESAQERTTISFYIYHNIANTRLFRDHLYSHYDLLGVRGRVYIASEGVNAQISVPTENLESFQEMNNEINFFVDLRLNIAIEDDGKSFFKLKILVRDKIVADGIDDPMFNPSNTGTYLKAKQFNQLIENDDAVLIDMRNHYESEIGHFKKAWTPDVDTFRESLPVIVDTLTGQKDKPIIMYCTGGIRCEKASAYMKHKGFKDVYHLEGGIIEYARQIEQQKLENKFIGKNFVFDERLSEKISSQVIAHCHQCGHPSDTHTNCANEACHLLFIQCDECKAKYENCCSTACQKTNALPLEEQRALRKGKPSKNNIFKKGRSNLPFANKPISAKDK